MKLRFSLLPLVLVAVLAGCAANRATPDLEPRGVAGSPVILPGQPSFASPEEAVDALTRASADKDLSRMATIMGLPEEDLVGPDATGNAERAAYFASARDEFIKVQPEGDALARVFVGKDNSPLASPIVRVGDRWFFDSAGGRDELVARVVSENEAATVAVCRTYVEAQYEYYAEDRDGDDVLEYAQKLGSARGQRDGLYWHTEEGERESPLGPLIAGARATGYLRGSVRKLDEPKPYHGYLFQVLTAQGESAPGGRYSYILNGHMVAGFAMIASPARWNHTGTMTFLVGANGKVYQKNLGENTAETAAAMTEYNPGGTWALVTE